MATSISLIDAAQAAAERGFGIETEPDADTGIRGRVYVRRDFGIESFGVNAFYQANAGAIVVQEHDEIGPGASRHEELYVVVEGGCTFVVDGETVEAPRGTAVFAAPESRRSARASEDGTIVLVVGGRPGEAFRVGPGEALGSFFRDYRAGDYESALGACRGALELHPGNAMILYNTACLEALLGRPEEALAALDEALTTAPDFKEQAVGDDDLASLRDDPRFRALVGLGRVTASHVPGTVPAGTVPGTRTLRTCTSPATTATTSGAARASHFSRSRCATTSRSTRGRTGARGCRRSPGRSSRARSRS